jgi:hypothetical protein
MVLLVVLLIQLFGSWTYDIIDRVPWSQKRQNVKLIYMVFVTYLHDLIPEVVVFGCPPNGQITPDFSCQEDNFFTP